jgi:hypothetical protein
MSAPRLPTRTGDAWECSFFFDTARDVRAVSCRGGLIVAGGDELHLLRPGAQSLASRVPPLDIGPVRVVAAEPRAPWRYAVASEAMVAVFYRTPQGDQLLRLRCTPPGPSATHLAWGRDGAASALYIRWNDGAVVRVKQDMSGIDTPDLPPMAAIAADNAGVLAMISLAAPDPRTYVTSDGEHLEYRSIEGRVGRAQRVCLAVADTAVAYTIDDGGAFVSRVSEAPFVRYEALASAGAIEFQGAESDAALFGATHVGGVASILRVDAQGEAICIAEFGSDAAAVSPEVRGISWDGSRHMLWGASPQMGLVTCTAPDAKRGKRVVMS